MADAPRLSATENQELRAKAIRLAREIMQLNFRNAGMEQRRGLRSMKEKMRELMGYLTQLYGEEHEKEVGKDGVASYVRAESDIYKIRIFRLTQKLLNGSEKPLIRAEVDLMDGGSFAGSELPPENDPDFAMDFHYQEDMGHFLGRPGALASDDAVDNINRFRELRMAAHIALLMLDESYAHKEQSENEEEPDIAELVQSTRTEITAV